MDIQAIVFDVNGTLIDIKTDERMDQIFRSAGHFLTYQGINLRRHEVRDHYFRILAEQKQSSSENHPEFDAVGIWRQIIAENATDFTHGLPQEKLEQMPLFLAEMSRGIARHKLKLYPHVRKVLHVLREQVPLALVTDAQTPHARGELHQVGLLDFFNPVVVSGDHGYRKPDRRLFHSALDQLGVSPSQTLFVGDNIHRDVYGAQAVGMKTAMFCSGPSGRQYKGCEPDYRIGDHRELLRIMNLPALAS